MLSFQLKPGSGFIVACFVLCNFLPSSTGQTDQTPSISNSVATHICKQQSSFQDSGEIQTPLKAKPENDDSTCGWYLWTKCEDPKSESEPCPSFVLEACTELQVQKTGRKGKGIAQNQKQPRQQAATQCDNSTEQGLPKPEIVSSVTKYPSLVTIEEGDRCKEKFCTGLIVDENWVVVMQSGCMFLWRQPKHLDYYDVVAGEMKLYVEDESEQRRNIAEYIPHPGPEPTKLRYFKDNIGLIRVSAPFEFNENVQPINWTAVEAIAPSIEKSMLTIAGWTRAQRKKEDDVLEMSLIESPLDYFPMEECYEKKMEEDGAPKETLVCAGQCLLYGDEKNQPLRNVLFAQTDETSLAVPIGLGPLSSYGAVPQHGVFVNIASYIPWIQEQIQSGGQGQGQGQGVDSGSESGSRIIRGRDAPPHKYKSIVVLEGITSYGCSRQFCAGTILNEEWFVSASHCIGPDDLEQNKIIAGDHDITTNDGDEQVVSVVKVIQYPSDERLITKNDIAVVKVSPPFKFNDFVGKVTLPDPSFDPTGLVMAVGWGKMLDGSSPHILQETELPVVPLAECQSYWPPDPIAIGETHICAGNETHTVCKGDSGGPLYHIDESGEQIIVGIVSIGGAPCIANLDYLYDPFGGRASKEPGEPETFKPGAYTRITSFLKWIRENAEMEEA